MCTPRKPSAMLAKIIRSIENIDRVLSRISSISALLCLAILISVLLKISYTKVRVKLVMLNIARIVSSIFESCFIYILLVEKNKFIFKLYLKTDVFRWEGFWEYCDRSIDRSLSIKNDLLYTF
jgi:hypothetical protein